MYPPGDPSHFVVFVCMLLSWLFHVNCYISSSLSLRMVLFSSLPSGLLKTVASVSLTTILPSVPTALCLPAAAEGRECQAGAGVALVVAHAPFPGVGRGALALPPMDDPSWEQQGPVWLNLGHLGLDILRAEVLCSCRCRPGAGVGLQSPQQCGQLASRTESGSGYRGF